MVITRLWRLTSVNHRLIEESREIFETTLIHRHAGLMAFILKRGIVCASISLTDTKIVEDFIVLMDEMAFAIS